MTSECKKCSICGKLLCGANSGDHCWHHDVVKDKIPVGFNLCTSRTTSGFDRAQLDYHGNYGFGINHFFER